MTLIPRTPIKDGKFFDLWPLIDDKPIISKYLQPRALGGVGVAWGWGLDSIYDQGNLSIFFHIFNSELLLFMLFHI